MSQKIPPSTETISSSVEKHSETLIGYLVKTGIVDEKSVQEAEMAALKKRTSQKRYHNTLLLLSKYRIVLWALECIPGDIGDELCLPTRDLDQLIQRVDIELLLNNKKLENQLRSAAKTKMLIERVQEALWMLRKYPENGKRMYDLIYLTYIDPVQRTVEDILDILEISQRTYYRQRNLAIEIMSIRLWAAPTGEADMWLEVLTLIESL